MRCFVVAEFLLTSVSRGPSAIAKFLVLLAMLFVDLVLRILLFAIISHGILCAGLAYN